MIKKAQIYGGHGKTMFGRTIFTDEDLYGPCVFTNIYNREIKSTEENTQMIILFAIVFIFIMACAAFSQMPC
jgi:hypothetical protein